MSIVFQPTIFLLAAGQNHTSKMLINKGFVGESTYSMTEAMMRKGYGNDEERLR